MVEGRESNPHYQDPQSCALPLSYPPHLGWERWIRTTLYRFRADSSTSKLSPMDDQLFLLILFSIETLFRRNDCNKYMAFSSFYI